MFQTGGVPGVLLSRGLILPRSLDDSSPPTCPLDVVPSDWPVPDLGGDVRGRVRRFPRVTDVTPLAVFRAFVFVKIDPHLLVRLESRKPTCPS